MTSRWGGVRVREGSMSDSPIRVRAKIRIVLRVGVEWQVFIGFCTRPSCTTEHQTIQTWVISEIHFFKCRKCSVNLKVKEVKNEVKSERYI